MYEHYQRVITRRSSNGVWFCNEFSHIDKGSSNPFCMIGGSFWPYCMPYNQETKHLVGTSKSPIQDKTVNKVVLRPGDEIVVSTYNKEEGRDTWYDALYLRPVTAVGTNNPSHLVFILGYGKSIVESSKIKLGNV